MFGIEEEVVGASALQAAQEQYPLHESLTDPSNMTDVTFTSRRLGSPGFTVTIDTLTVVLVTSAGLYSICLKLARHKLRLLNDLQPQMTTKKLLILSVLLVSVLRIMTILGVAAMNMANVRAHYSLQPTRHNTGDKTQDFYDEAMTVLFDIPNAITVSTYVLLALVWAECFLEARFHTENSVHWKRRLLIVFMIFNTMLYATQLIIYACIFFLGSSNVVRTILYAAITGINFTAVVMVLCFYVYLNIRFSGFPFRSEEQRASLSRVSSVMTLWSTTRVIWGVVSLLVYVDNVELLQDTDTPLWSFIVLFVVFFICEVVPIVVLLDYSYYMQLLMGGSFLASQPQQQNVENDGVPLITPTQYDNNGPREGDSLLLQRSIQTMDRLLLTSPRDEGGSTPTNNSRRVRFQDAASQAEDPFVQPA